jgi:hypothetical protein
MFLSLVILAIGIWRASGSGLALWLGAQRFGGIRAMLPVASGWLAADVYRNQIYVSQDAQLLAIPYPRPLQFFPDQNGGAYVLGMLASRLDRIDSNGRLREALILPSKFYVRAALAESGGVWMVWHSRRRALKSTKANWYMPEIATFRWCLDWFGGLLDGRRFYPRDRGFACVEEQWHEETAGTWRLLATADRLLVVNDEAETITCLSKETGHLLWKVPTRPRPTAAVIWHDRLLVSSAHADTVDAYRIDDGRSAWAQPASVGRGVADLALVGDQIAAADFVHDRLLLLDPSSGTVANELPVAGAPRSLAALPDGLLVGFDAIAKVVRFDRDWRGARTWDIAAEVNP